MSKHATYPAPKNGDFWIDSNTYQTLYQQSISDPAAFWDKMAEEHITWYTTYQHVLTGDFNSHNTAWFSDGKLNTSYNCLDRHLEKNGNKTAIIWQGDNPAESKKISYAELHRDVCRFANVLKNNGIQKGDRVCIYLPMIPEVAVAMLACTRIGAIHSVVFSAFSAAALKTRINDAQCKLVITADESIRGGKIIPLKINVDAALTECPSVEKVIVVKRTGATIPWNENKDICYTNAMKEAALDCEPVAMDANDPLFILYTSGSTGKPKGILHSTGGYLVYVATTFKYIFNYHDNDIFWCTADVGWITGHSYLIYGPLLNSATTLMFEGVPSYPDYSRLWQIIDEYQVTTFYTAPTAIRALRKEGNEWLKNSSRQSLKLLGSVGEPINPDVWEWYYHEVGRAHCPIVDTWWQTETGGILISALPGATPLKPGAASWPFFGIQPEIVDDQGHKAAPNVTGKLVIKKPWPGLMQTIYGDRQRFVDSYFKEFPGNYFTGDDGYYDEDGYFWVTGRNDDIIKVSGHRIGTGEVESALLSHPDIAEAAVVAVPHAIKGDCIYAFVTPNAHITPSDELKKSLLQAVRNEIGPIATPEYIQWTTDLPKTRSGKIMRRILRKIANNDVDDLGDTSTLTDPSVINTLITHRKAIA
jgi:acetyl-CoA synthetase